MKKKNHLLFVTLMGAAVLTACQQKQERQQETLAVETLTVKYTANFGSQKYVGQVEEASSTAVSFAAMGTLSQVLVSEGQRVKKGETLAIMDATSAQNALAAAKAQMEQANDALNRMQMLHETNALPEIKWVEVQSQVQQAEAQYELMKKQVSDCNLVAPCAGIVGNGVMNAGEVVVPSEPVLHILNINKVKVNISIPEKELASVTAKTEAQIGCDALPDEMFHSNSFVKSVQADAMTHTYKVSFWVNNPEGKLLPGMVCDVTLSDKHVAAKSAICVPVRCVQQSADGKEFVWVVRNDKAYRQHISLGATLGNDIEVTSGLSEGDKVIVAGYQKVSEGQRTRD